MVVVPELIGINCDRRSGRSYLYLQSAHAPALGELMPATPPSRFGTILRVFLAWADIDHSELARYLSLDLATIRDLEIGGPGKTVLLTQQFYERLRHVPGFSDEAINLLKKAREIDELTEELAEHLGPFVPELGSYELSDQQNLLLVEPLNTLLQDLSLEFKIIKKEDKEEHQVPPTEIFTDTNKDAIISLPMPPSTGENEHSLAKHISDLRSHPTFGAERKPPIHYPHENVVFHVAQLQAEARGKNGEEQPDRLMTLKEAAGLYPDEVSYGDVLRWHYSGLLEEQGRRWLARPGGRSIPLVSQVEVAYLKDNRPPRGPTESFKKKMRKHIDSLKK
jgi:hypothetical protein